ncbi:MAG: hypothetical protein J0M08_09255 [Bacteroidetes bacterium]|nr:hypothetical protein [Bacteroidota bacterium]
MKAKKNLLVRGIVPFMFLFVAVFSSFTGPTTNSKTTTPPSLGPDVSKFLIGEWALDSKAIINGERNKTVTVYNFRGDQTLSIDVDGVVTNGDYIVSSNSIVMILPQKDNKLVFQHSKTLQSITNEKIEWYYFLCGKKVTETLYKKGTRAYLSSF